jgi:4a-hydroxytetrahydrobiopterin dehydratase
MSRERLTEQQLAEAMQELDGWEVRDGKLHREFRFSDFVEAFAFMTSSALHAESMDHHPDWANVYNRVTVDLHTHDRGGITGRDIELARRMMTAAGGKRAG